MSVIILIEGCGLPNKNPSAKMLEEQSILESDEYLRTPEKVIDLINQLNLVPKGIEGARKWKSIK